jgi:heavy metal sensor kinase
MSSASRRPRRGFSLRPRTIGGRLTLFATLITFLACALICAAVYAGMYVSLNSEVNNFLEGEVAEFRAGVADHAGPLEELGEEIRRELGSRARGDLAFRLYDGDGRLLFTSNPYDASAASWRPPADRGALDTAFFQTVKRADGVSMRLCSLRSTLSGGESRIFQAAYLLDQVATSLRHYLRIGIAALIAAAGLAHVGGRFIARRSLKPIEGIISSAQQIGAARLNERVPRSGNDDELDRLAATINDMLERIERQMLQIQRFTADASHELRTPLAALRGHAEVALARERSAEELREVLAEGIQEYDRLGRIAEDLLLLARLDSGAGALRIEPMLLDDAVADVVDLYAPLAADRGLNLQLASRAPVMVNGDRGRIRQLVSNLIDNAIKYAGSGAEIRISVGSDEQGARLVVADTGAGISAEHLPRVFDRFYRIDEARSRGPHAGAGLGLSICRSVVHALGGRIEIASRTSRTGAEGTSGTTITVHLPLSDAASQTVAASDAALTVF